MKNVFCFPPKVRCLWATVMETVTFLQKEREVVDSVVKGHVDQYTLDGTSVSVSIPRPLLQKVEKEMYKVSFLVSVLLFR